MSETRDVPGAPELTDLQLAILGVLWAEDEATVNDVREGLAGRRDLARTTVATLLSRLEDRGVVAHREEGREFVYRPTVTEEEVLRSRVDALAEYLFGGDVPTLVSRLLDARDLEPSELDRVRRLIEDKEAGLTDEERGG
ncbi:MAG TPA: BlaI/MecI/CopY family transcriptional regulator [Gemmatimonadota bacterium]|nr:BlaI/MecI/CopY family transcriptional regulator [Gemmatimonadota bacterium]